MYFFFPYVRLLRHLHADRTAPQDLPGSRWLEVLLAAGIRVEVDCLAPKHEEGIIVGRLPR